MEPIINPVDKELIIAELSSDKFLRHTNKGRNEIYIVDAFNSPNVMKEIGRRLGKLLSAVPEEVREKVATLMSLMLWKNHVAN